MSLSLSLRDRKLSEKELSDCRFKKKKKPKIIVCSIFVNINRSALL
jgi:hypothetical protein